MILQDISYSLRRLLHTPGATLVVLLSLSLALGAYAAIFSVIEGVLLEPLEYPHAESLVIVSERNLANGAKDLQTSVPTFLDWQHRCRGFESLAGALPVIETLLAGDEPEVVKTSLVSANFFRTLGVQPVVGRDLTAADDDRAHPASVAIVSYELWQSRFGGSRSAVGRTIHLGATPITIVGVAPPRIRTPGGTRIWAPLALAPLLFPSMPDVLTKREQRQLHVFGRLAKGTGLAHAQRDLQAVERQLAQDFPKSYHNLEGDLVPLRERAVRSIRPSLLLLQLAVVLVLLIAGANLANLLLARALDRERDLAVRVALGVDRRRLVQQTVSESLLLTLGGGLAGTFLSLFALRALLKVAPASLPYTDRISVNAVVFAATLAASFVLGLVAGLVPAVRVAALGGRESSLRPLSQIALQRSATRRSLRSQGLLVGIEICLAVLLLIVTGLVVRSFVELERTDPGFSPHHVLALAVSLPADRYAQPERVAEFYRRSLDNLAALPGVTAVAAASDTPLEGTSDSAVLTLPGAPSRGNAADAGLTVAFVPVSTGYFKALEVPLQRGRDFTSRDISPAPHAAIINRSLADLLWPGQDPVGRFITRDNDAQLEVIGVVGDIKHNTMAEKRTPYAYEPTFWNNMTLLVRTGGAPELLGRSCRAAIHAVDPQQAIYSVQTLDSVVERVAAPARFSMLLFGFFGVIAAVLAAAGIAAVLSLFVARQRHEIGIRMALGANRGEILRFVMGRGIRLTSYGLAAALVSALGVVRFTRSLLFEVRPFDLQAFAGAAVVMAAISLLACAVPVWKASRLNPLEVLRPEP